MSRLLSITVKTWLGPSSLARKNLSEDELERLIRKTDVMGFITKLPLHEALSRLENYLAAINQAHPFAATEYEVISISEIHDDGSLTPDTHPHSDHWPGPDWVEHVPQSLNELGIGGYQ